MAIAGLLFNEKKRIEPLAVVGFLAPILFAVVVALILHAVIKPIASPVRQITNASGGVTDTTPVNQPTADEIKTANQVIYAYCANDVRSDVSCALIPNSTMTAPGFVETGLKMNTTGQFAPDGAASSGVALAKGSGSDWAVVWVGTGCIPQNIASQYSVPSTLNICST